MSRYDARKKNKNKGSTMVETLVSFVVLFVVLAGLYGIVSFSSELYMRSVDTSRLHQKFYSEIYRFSFGPVGETTTVNYDSELIGYKDYTPGTNGENYAGLFLVVDDTKTDPNNYANKQAIKDAYISLSRIGATGFFCIDDDNNENLVLPKAIHFWWDDPASN